MNNIEIQKIAQRLICALVYVFTHTHIYMYARESTINAQGRCLRLRKSN